MTVDPSRELVLQKLRDCFPDSSEADEALAVLDTYGTEPWHREQHRVQLAILRMSASDLQQLRRHVESAKSDYRDALVAAEFLEEYQASSKTTPDEMAEIRRRDREQYRAWLMSERA